MQNKKKTINTTYAVLYDQQRKKNYSRSRNI